VLGCLGAWVLGCLGACPVVSANPNMLRLAATQNVLSAPNPTVWGWRPSGAQTEQGLKGRRRFPATVMPKRELVQVNLKLTATDTMVGADQPLLEIADRPVRERHDRGNAFAKVFAHRLGAWHVRETGGRQTRKLFQAVGIDRRPRQDMAGLRVKSPG